MTKIQKKAKKQQQWGFQPAENVPLVLLSQSEDSIRVLLVEVLDAIRSLGIQVAVVSPTDREELKRWKDLEAAYKGTLSLVPEKEAQEDVFDLEIMEELSADRLKSLHTCPRVPIAGAGSIQNFDPISETGNGFLFKKRDPWSLFIALVRASETYRFPYDWKNLLKAVKQS